MSDAIQQRDELRRLSRTLLAELQLAKLKRLLSHAQEHSTFYQARWKGLEGEINWDFFRSLPFISKEDLVVGLDAAHSNHAPSISVLEKQHGDKKCNSKEGWLLAANHTWPTEFYSRVHRTSGTRGKPLVVLDTQEDWHWWMEVWQYVLDTLDIVPGDRVFLAFSFGPFVGFWSAFEACQKRGALVIPGGGMSSLARLEWIRDSGATVVGCTPSYALHLAEIAEQNHLDLASCNVRKMLVAGEPGGSISATKARIESAWGATVVDHAGATEIGPWGFATEDGSGLHVTETEFIAEFLPRPDFGDDVSELVLTNLGRFGCPVIRYRTGDLVRPSWPTQGDQSDASNSLDACQFVRLKGGIIGRADDMLIVRGVNIFPGSIEAVLHSFPEIDEYRVTLFQQGNLDQIKVEIEGDSIDANRIANALQVGIGLRMDVVIVGRGELPRFEGKGRRFCDQRQQG
ncbi:MAG: Phenylacetate-coenzyme ligase [Planctomycetota bacterium]|jgi:phenylacetate-CoA ligase